MNILFADAHVLVREVIAAFIEDQTGGLVTQASTLSEALEAVAESEPFDLILLEHNILGTNALEGLERMLRACKDRPVALLAEQMGRPVVQQAFQVGAAGYLPKTLSARSFLNAMRFMMMGETYIPQDMIDHPDFNMARITLRKDVELEILRRICAGETNRMIAVGLGIPEQKVKVHVKSIFKQLGAVNRTEAAIIARESGVVA